MFAQIQLNEKIQQLKLQLETDNQAIAEKVTLLSQKQQTEFNDVDTIVEAGGQPQVQAKINILPAHIYQLYQTKLATLTLLQDAQQELAYYDAYTKLETLLNDETLHPNVVKHTNIFLEWIAKQKSGDISYYDSFRSIMHSRVDDIKTNPYDNKWLTIMLTRTHELLDANHKGSKKEITFSSGKYIYTKYSKNHNDYKNQLINEVPGAPNKLILLTGCITLAASLMMSSEWFLLSSLAMLGVGITIVVGNLVSCMAMLGIFITVGIGLCLASQVRTGPSQMMLNIVDAYEQQENERCLNEKNEAYEANNIAITNDYNDHISALKSYDLSHDDINNTVHQIADQLVASHDAGLRTPYGINMLSIQIQAMLSSATSAEEIDACAEHALKINGLPPANDFFQRFFWRSTATLVQQSECQTLIESLQEQLKDQLHGARMRCDLV